jgi:hypothetical protein
MSTKHFSNDQIGGIIGIGVVIMGIIAFGFNLFKTNDENNSSSSRKKQIHGTYLAASQANADRIDGTGHYAAEGLSRKRKLSKKSHHTKRKKSMRKK